MSGEEKQDTILVVEDNELNQELVCDLLELYGYRVLCADDANSFWRHLKAELPDLVLMDLQLPETDGLTLVKEVKALPEYKTCPIVALTAYAMPGDQEKALGAGCEGIIIKPIDTREFPNQIKQFLTAHK